ncbi:MAG: hypothetical protein M1835_007121 [Candelina submexicana]|nr:MAG: hypothetical protein M1835_007121 [Candelina submexicana]
MLFKLPTPKGLIALLLLLLPPSSNSASPLQTSSKALEALSKRVRGGTSSGVRTNVVQYGSRPTLPPRCPVPSPYGKPSLWDCRVALELMEEDSSNRPTIYQTRIWARLQGFQGDVYSGPQADFVNTPRTWDYGGCVIQLDIIPRTSGHVMADIFGLTNDRGGITQDVATKNVIKHAAKSILDNCVKNGPKVGGTISLGYFGSMRITVYQQAPDPSKSAQINSAVLWTSCEYKAVRATLDVTKCPSFPSTSASDNDAGAGPSGMDTTEKALSAPAGAAACSPDDPKLHLLNDLSSDPFISAELTKRSYPFPVQRCHSYFGSPDTTDCVRAARLMFEGIPNAAIDSYETYTNDIHLPALEGHSIQMLPQAWYGPLGNCALRISINDELNLPLDQQWDMETWATLQFEAVGLISECTDTAVEKTGGTQIVGHNDKLNITIYDPKSSEYELDVAKNTWQPRVALANKPGLSTIPRPVLDSGLEASPWLIPTAVQANYCISSIACRIKYQLETACKILSIGKQYLAILFGAIKEAVDWGVCEGGSDIARRNNFNQPPPYNPMRDDARSPNPISSRSKSLSNVQRIAPASSSPKEQLTTEEYCRLHRSALGCRFGTYIRDIFDSAFCHGDPICLTSWPYTGKCLLIYISASALLVLFGIRRAIAEDAAAEALAVEQEEMQDALEMMTEGLRQLQCLPGNEMTNRYVRRRDTAGKRGPCIAVCQWRPEAG